MKYALSVACVSLGICLILQTLEFLIPGFLEWNLVPPSNGSEGHRVEKVCSVVLLLWWCIGTGIITFKGELGICLKFLLTFIVEFFKFCDCECEGLLLVTFSSFLCEFELNVGVFV